MSENQNKPNIGTRAARTVNFEEFFKPFADQGYTMSETSLDAVCNNNEFWTTDNYVVPEKITLLKPKGSKTIVAGVGLDFDPKEYEQITIQLQEGTAAKTRVSELEKKLQDTRDQLHGTKTGIKGLESQKETESKALAALKNEITVLGEKRQKLDTDIGELESTRDKTKAELETYIKDNTPKKQELEKDVKALESQRADLETYVKDNAPKKQELEQGIAELQKQKKEREEALERFKVADASERAELEKECGLIEQELKANLDDIRDQIIEKKVDLEDIEAKIKAASEKPAEPEAPAAPETPAEPAKEEVLDVTKTPEYTGLQALYRDRVSAINKLLSTLLTDLPDIPPFIPLDKQLLVDFYDAAKRLQEEAAQAGISEQAEGFLNDLLGAVYEKPNDEELADPAYVRAFVEGVRECGFELYSLIASRNPEGMAYVLKDLADSKFEEGDRVAAAELTERAIALCKEKLPEDKERLAQFEANLQIYSDNSE